MVNRTLLRAGSSVGSEGTVSSLHGAEATPEQTTSFTASPGAPVRTAGPMRGREKPKEIIVGFFNQGLKTMHAYTVRGSNLTV